MKTEEVYVWFDTVPKGLTPLWLDMATQGVCMTIVLSPETFKWIYLYQLLYFDDTLIAEKDTEVEVLRVKFEIKYLV